MMLTRVPAVTTSVGSAGAWAGRAVSVRSVAWIVTDHRDAAALEQAARKGVEKLAAAAAVALVGFRVSVGLGGLVFDVVCAVVAARWIYYGSRSIRPCCVRAGPMVQRRALAWFFLPVIGSQAASVLAGGRPFPPRS